MEYDLVTLKRQINFLEKRLDLDTVNIKFLFNELNNYFPTIPVGVTEIKKGAKVFRGRIHEGGPSYTNIKDFSYVPHEEKAKSSVFGRANFPKQSLFYSSDNLNTAQLECISKDTKHGVWFLTFGEWEVKEDLTIADIVLDDRDEIRMTSAWEHRVHVHNLIKQLLSKEQYKCSRLILDFFGKQFANPEVQSDKHHLYSVYLANRLLCLNIEGKPIDGVRYPSIPMLYQGSNIVLKPEVVDNNMISLKDAYEITCGIGGGKQLQSKIENSSKSIEGGKINWRVNGRKFGSRQ